MRPDLEKVADAYLLPSAAVYGRAGQSYLLVVEGGVTRRVPVAVQVNDGAPTNAAVATPADGGRQVTREPTGDEVVVVSRRLEVDEKARVAPVFGKW